MYDVYTSPDLGFETNTRISHISAVQADPYLSQTREAYANSLESLDQLIPFEETELGITFNEIVDLAANQPDSEVFSQDLRTMVLQAKESGRIEASLYMAAVIGAMACLHPHLAGLANEATEAIFGEQTNTEVPHAGENHDHQEETDHDARTCDDCNNGRSCRRK